METRLLIIDEQNKNYNSNKPATLKVEVLYCDITDYSQKSQFIICTLVVFVLFLVYGYLQELIFTVDGFKGHGWYLTLVQFGFYTIFGYGDRVFKGSHVRKIPIRIYCFLAVLTLGTMGFSNASLSYLNYPTQVIFKCCKLIPVMIGSILIQGKRYGAMDFAAALFMCIGLALFTLADSQVLPNFDIVGYLMISSALLCDALIGNVQEKYMKFYTATTHEVTLFSYSIGFVYLLTILLVFGNINHSIIVSMNRPVIYFYALLFSLTGYLGMQVVLTLVTSCGALVAVTVTTCRKAVSIVISFILFAKPFTIQYLWGGVLVLFGIYLNFLAKNRVQFISNFSSTSFIRKQVSFIKNCFRGHQKHLEMTV